jgi:thiol-disulfide isomerase/thioredoxin
MFPQLFNNNPGVLVLKFGADWCGPCKQIEPLVTAWFELFAASDRVLCLQVNIDENAALYSFLKSKRRINGIPAILCWYKNNVHYIPDDMVAGTDVHQVNAFFQRILQQLKQE